MYFCFIIFCNYLLLTNFSYYVVFVVVCMYVSMFACGNNKYFAISLFNYLFASLLFCFLVKSQLFAVVVCILFFFLLYNCLYLLLHFVKTFV